MNLELNKVYNMCNMEGMKQIPDKFFELAIVDPPYGIGAGDVKRGGTQSGSAKTRSKKYDKKDWDSSPPDRNYFNELIRISENQIIWGANHFIELVPSPNSSCWIVWDKDNGDNGYADCELAYCSFKTAVRKIKYTWHGMIQQDMKNKEARFHPTQKPIQLYKWLLKNYAKPGDKILDTHLGSGSSRIAAYDMGFDFLGFELDKEYYDKAEARFNQHIRQQVLFPPNQITPKLFEAA